MRAEYAAALTNFLLILLTAVGLSMASSLWDSGTVVYANPVKAAVLAVVIPVLVATPLATLAFWRTWVHAQGFQARNTTGWQGWKLPPWDSR